MKYVWKITARAETECADRSPCYAYAGSMREALELAGEPDAKAVPQIGKHWHGPDSVHVVWDEIR